MAKQRIGNVARAARAALREALGKVTGNRGLEAQGAAEKAALTPNLPAAEKAALTPNLPAAEKAALTPNLPAAEKAALTPNLPAAEKAALTPRPEAHGRRAPG